MQTLWLDQTDLLNRIVGFMSHWMTFSGQLMIGTVSLSGYLLFFILSGERRRWSRFAGYFLIFLFLTTALILTFTRSAWIGTVGGLLLMLAIYRLRWAVFGGLTILFIFLLLPVPFQERFYSSFDPSDTTTRGRIELLKTGANLILDNPWTGVGPRMVQEKALEYREEKDLPDYLYQHFHNNLVQIAAEMGIPAVLVWSVLWIWIIRDLLHLKKPGKSRPFLNCLAVNGICVLLAVQLAGLLEYNFGDSEIAILLFFFVTVPYVAGRGRSEVGA
jgi:O-antigen ligase